jgi:hypothetical protein
MVNWIDVMDPNDSSLASLDDGDALFYSICEANWNFIVRINLRDNHEECAASGTIAECCVGQLSSSSCDFFFCAFAGGRMNQSRKVG